MLEKFANPVLPPKMNPIRRPCIDFLSPKLIFHLASFLSSASAVCLALTYHKHCDEILKFKRMSPKQLCQKKLPRGLSVFNLTREIDYPDLMKRLQTWMS